MKYKLTDESKEWYGIILYRIEAVEAFGDVQHGDHGGFVQSEENLDQSGDAWVSGDAQVYGKARVSGNAQVYGDAQVSGKARVSGNARVSGDAQVYGDARVSGDAQVYGKARVSGNAQVSNSFDLILIGPIGSRKSFITILPKQNWIATGCFSGTREKFLGAVEKTHGNNEHGKAYRLAIDFAFSVRG